MYCAIIGDLVDSREMAPKERQSVQTQLKTVLLEVSARWENSIASKFVITLGDEFQGLLHTLSPAADIAEYIACRLHPQTIRFGIGYGEIYTDINPDMALGADGPAYHLARRGMDALKSSAPKEHGFLMRFRTGMPDEALLDVICDELNHLKSAWTVKQQDLILAFLEGEEQQNLLAKRFSLNPSTVTRHLQAARFAHYRRSLSGLSTYFSDQYDKSADSTPKEEPPV